MHTISMLRRTLGLSSDNQVRNRLEEIKDLLSDHIRRGPNNQIFLTDGGLGLLKRFQELHESGLTLGEASSALRVNELYIANKKERDQSGFRLNEMKRQESHEAGLAVLKAELMEMHAQIKALVDGLKHSAGTPDAVCLPSRWWIELREDVDVS